MNFAQINNRITTYFQRLNTQEWIAWAAIGVGFVLLIIGFLLL